MAMKTTLDKKSKDIKEAYLHDFAMLDELTRNAIVKDIKAYHKLTNFKAYSFEEFALLPKVKEKGLIYSLDKFPYKDVIPNCPVCCKDNKVYRAEVNKYKCRSCDKKFAANYNSIVSGTKKDAKTWMKVLMCLLESFSIERTCSFCDIEPNTYYFIRNRLFYAMQLMMDEVNLYGIIEADNTFTRVSFKGMDLNDEEFPDNSPVDCIRFLPRRARKRGRRNKIDERDFNSLCIFTAIDDYGHVMTRYVKIGAADSSTLNKIIDENKFLKTVPSKDPFQFASKKEGVSKVGSNTIFVSDKERSIIKFSEKLNVETEFHVFRKNGIQCKLPDGSHNIQRVNSLHKRLKDFFRKNNYFSSRYLPGYLTLFEFVENTKASDAAICKLFEILAQPGLGKNPSFFDNLFTVPNYIIERSNSSNPLNKYDENKLYSIYLYGKYKDGANITVNDIAKLTNYSTKSIRRNYKNFAASDMLELINEYFENKENKRSSNTKKINKTKLKFPPEVFAVYDEYVKFRLLPRHKRCSIPDFFSAMNDKYGLNYSLNTWRNKCDIISNNELKETLPSMIQYENSDSVYSIQQTEAYIEMFREYRKLRAKMSRDNVNVTDKEICENLATKYALSKSTIYGYINCARKIIKSRPNYFDEEQ